MDGLQLYLHKLKKPLTCEEEKKIIDDWYFKHIESARDTLFEHNLRLVASIVFRNFRHLPRHELEDLIQEGNLALGAVIKNFDPSKGVRFATFAYRSIYLHLYKKINLEKQKAPFSLDEFGDNGVTSPVDGMRFDDGETIVYFNKLSRMRDEDESYIAEDCADKDFVERAIKIINNEARLERDKEICLSYLGFGGIEPKTYEELGNEHGISTIRVGQIFRKTMSKVRDELVK